MSKIISGTEFKIVSSSRECLNCLFNCEIVVEELKEVKIYCRHPKGPGNPEHCIYYKQKRN
ncbi:hypothetical protein [Methanobacterium alcaliphilum]|uniref:hypothetical protein n=1 Tax=Methanobacterium alcaliphilum TaxID=392018 RepID=UPI00200A4693|nr:hypothetical protein [Methanobacterium alcaliphilum]MCK9151578.1 hypothetical protein [Methanobacterium alcaliphilum]